MISEQQTYNNKVIGGIILTIVLIFFLTLFLTPLLKLTEASNTSIFLYSRLFCWLSLILIYLYSLRVEKQNFLIWTETKYSFGYYLKSIISTLFLTFGILALITITIRLDKININNSRLEEIVEVLKNNKSLLIFTALTAGVTEELIFRGYIMPRLEQLIKNKYLIIFLSALFFGIAHIGHQSITKMILIFIIGIIFGTHYYKYRNIKILIISHFIWDLIGLTLKTL